MANPTLTEKFNAGIGGKEWRCYEIEHTGEATCTVPATDLKLEYIEAIIGHTTPVPVQAAAGSILCDMGISISADHRNLVWGSTVACVQNVTVIGW